MCKVLLGLVAGLALVGASLAPATAQSTATKQPKASPAATAPASPATTAPSNAGAATGPAGSFSTEAAAKAHCSSDTVMWGNAETKVLHYAGSKSYGKTKHGGYMCESEATKSGYHVAKGEKHA